MTGPGIHETVADVEAAWELWVKGDPRDYEHFPPHRLVLRERRGDYTTDLRESKQVVVAYVSGGKWIADCPVCNGGIPCWHENPRGCCLDCGTIFQVDNPKPDEVDRVNELLAVRDLHLRNYHRHRDDTVEKLVEENALITREKILSGAVSIDAVREILGDDAIEKLRGEGAIV